VDSFIIEDVKSFTSKLFIKEDFDFFLLKEAEITTFNNYKIRPGYGEELYEMLFNYISITPESHVVEVFKRNHMI